MCLVGLIFPSKKSPKNLSRSYQHPQPSSKFTPHLFWVLFLLPSLLYFTSIFFLFFFSFSFCFFSLLIHKSWPNLSLTEWERGGETWDVEVPQHYLRAIRWYTFQLGLIFQNHLLHKLYWVLQLITIINIFVLKKKKKKKMFSGWKIRTWIKRKGEKDGVVGGGGF